MIKIQTLAKLKTRHFLTHPEEKKLRFYATKNCDSFQNNGVSTFSCCQKKNAVKTMHGLSGQAICYVRKQSYQEHVFCVCFI